MPYLEVDDINLYYVTYDKNELLTDLPNPNAPTLIVLHGGPGFDHKHMVPFWSTLSNNIQVIFVDQRGNGLSTKSSKDKWNLAQWAKDVKQFSDTLGLQGKVFLAGSSFGSYVAQAAITVYPEAFAGAILTDADAYIDFPYFLQLLAEKAREKNFDADSAVAAATKWFQQGDASSIGDYVKYCLPLFDNKPQRSMADDLKDSIQTSEVMTHFNTTELLKFDFRTALKKVKCPVLLIAGDVSPYHSEASATKLANALPASCSEFHLFKGVGTPVYNHVPNEARKLMTEFIEKILAPAAINISKVQENNNIRLCL